MNIISRESEAAMQSTQKANHHGGSYKGSGIVSKRQVARAQLKAPPIEVDVSVTKKNTPHNLTQERGERRRTHEHGALRATLDVK